jgi:hypothetical protein
MMDIRTAIGATLLAAQALLIGYARTTEARYFCWAPFDMQTDYRVEVTLNGRALTPREVRERYRRPQTGVDNRSVRNLIDTIEGVEQRRSGEQARVLLTYRINGRQEQTWRWPRE